MAIHSEHIKDGERIERERPGIQWNRVAAGVAWLGGVATTYLFVHKAAPDLFWLPGIIVAATVQALLTLGERPLWRRLLGRKGGKAASLALIITFVDALVNAAGIYPYVGRLAQTDLGTMLAEVLNVQPQMGPLAAFSVALFLGLIVAALPEFLWESS